MAQQGARATGEDRGHPAALAGERAPPDGVDAAVHPMQPARLRHAVDLAAREPQRHELPVRHDAVLEGHPRGEAFTPSRWILSTATVRMSHLDPHGPQPAWKAVPQDPRIVTKQCAQRAGIPTGPSAPMPILNRP